MTAVLLVVASCVPTDDRRPDGDWQTLGKLDLTLQRAATTDVAQPLRVIVRAASGNLDGLAAVIEASGGRVVERFAVIDAVAAEIRSDSLLVLSQNPVVTSVSIDSVVDSAQKKAKGGGKPGGGGEEPPAEEPPAEDPPAEPEGQSHLRNTLGLDDEPWEGSGINVAIIDSGVGFVPGVPLVGLWDFRDGRNPRFNRSEAPSDPHGHGTHVAGLIANGGWWSDGLYRGVARAVSLYGLRVLDENGAGYTSDVIRAIAWVLENQGRAQVDVINLSLGHPILEPAENDPLVQAVEAAVRAGIVVVVSAGNYGYNRETGETGYAGITSPGNAPSAITVGALDTLATDARTDDIVARYSSRGPTWYDAFAKPDIVAPGSSLVSTASATNAILAENPQLEAEEISVAGIAYFKLSGTSMATAVTSGVVAAMLDASRSTFGGASVTPNAIKAMLHYSALPLPDDDVLTQGAGGLQRRRCARAGRKPRPERG